MALHLNQGHSLEFNLQTEKFEIKILSTDVLRDETRQQVPNFNADQKFKKIFLYFVKYRTTNSFHLNSPQCRRILWRSSAQYFLRVMSGRHLGILNKRRIGESVK